MNKHHFEIYSSITSTIIIIIFFYKFKEKISQLMRTSLNEISNYHPIEEEIRNLENQIEKINKNLFLIDNNINNITLSLKKLTRNYQSREQDLKEKFAEIKRNWQTEIMDKHHKHLLIEIMKLASSEIINCPEKQDSFYKEITIHFPNNKK